MNVNFDDLKEDSPLSVEDINKIAQSNLTILERHHVRLLAHCLACFKSMVNLGVGTDSSIPDENLWLKWCLAQPNINNDDDFVQLLLEQFRGAANQLEELSKIYKVLPLDLTLEDLLNAYGS